MDSDESRGVARTATLRRAGRVLLYVALLGYSASLFRYMVARPDQFLFDMRTYYYGGMAYRQGLNPYDNKSISKLAGEDIGFAFCYPPCMLPLCALMCTVPFGAFFKLFLVTKLLLLCGLVWFWRREFLRGDADALFYVLLLFGFNCCIYLDVSQGNVSIVIQCLLWAAFACFVRGRLLAFTCLVVAAGVCKLQPIAFLALLFFSPSRKRFVYLAGGVAGLGLILLCSRLLQPELFAAFVHKVIGEAGNRGGVNPSTLAFLESAALFLRSKGASVRLWWCKPALLVIAGAVCLTTYLRVQRLGDAIDLKMKVFVGCVAIVLSLPRFKDYSYILLLVPTYYAIRHCRRVAAYPLLLVLVCLTQHHKLPFFYSAFESLVWPYWPLLVAYGVWGLYLFDVLPNAAERVGEGQGG